MQVINDKNTKELLSLTYKQWQSISGFYFLELFFVMDTLLLLLMCYFIKDGEYFNAAAIIPTTVTLAFLTVFFGLIAASEFYGDTNWHGLAQSYGLIQTQQQIETTEYKGSHLLFGWRKLHNPATGVTMTPIARFLVLPSNVFVSVLVSFIWFILSKDATAALATLIALLLVNVILAGCVNVKRYIKNLTYKPNGNNPYILVNFTSPLKKGFKRLYHHFNYIEDYGLKGFEKDDTTGMWVYKLICKQHDIYLNSLLAARIVNYAFANGIIDAKDYENEITCLDQIIHKDIYDFVFATTSFFDGKKNKVAAAHAFKLKVEASCNEYIEKANALFATLNEKLATDYKIACNQTQLSLMNSSCLDALVDINLNWNDSPTGYHALEFQDLEKRVVAKNLVTSMLPELHKLLDAVRGKDDELESAIVAQIAKVDSFIRRLAVDDKASEVEAEARLIDAHSRNLLELSLPDTVTNNVSNQLAVNERYLNSRQQILNKP